MRHLFTSPVRNKIGHCHVHPPLNLASVHQQALEMPFEVPNYPSSFPRVNWDLPGALEHPPFTASDLDQEIRWAARAASRAWADGTVLDLSPHEQQTALRLCILDKVLEW